MGTKSDNSELRGLGADLQKLGLTQVAKLYGVSTPAEAKLFRRLYPRVHRARKWAHGVGAAVAKAAVEAEVAKLAKLATLSAPTVDPGGVGHVDVRSVGGGERYVVFSDLHIAATHHRQNFFGKNVKLYADVLEQYRAVGCTVVENGDVEELLVLDPYLSSKEMDQLAKLEPTSSSAAAVREGIRLRWLERIVADGQNEPYYRAIRRLSAAGRYVRITGNHDSDLVSTKFWDVLRQPKAAPAMPRPVESLILRDAAGCAAIICHGHQFDRVTTPAVAFRVGEVISESISWGFQGADRNWKWRDHVNEWALGLKTDQPLRNVLVTDKPGADDLGSPDAEGQGLLGKAAFWEALFGHNVAWEYFDGLSPGDAISDRVFGPKAVREFFKFRHLDELHLEALYTKTFPDAAKRPKLVIGHSHEIRHDARGANGIASWYLNSGAAGRFERMVTGVEIDAQGARVVVWALDDDGTLQRRVLDPVDAPNGERLIVARKKAEPLT
ncbi:MAG: hypothetical protein H6698_05875 [Myxococcales bacterium]|nr:hypothetical protein [Myxococcales bacterium]MCB9533833.1 hypothetical protein [Myxococcales bacterium]